MVIEWAGNDGDSSVEYRAVSWPICGELWGGRGRGGLEAVVPLNSIYSTLNKGLGILSGPICEEDSTHELCQHGLI